MSRKLKILFTPVNFVGPVNSNIGIAQVLKESGHDIVFAVTADWMGQLEIYGFSEEIIGELSQPEGNGSVKKNAESVLKILEQKIPIEKEKDCLRKFLSEGVDDIKKNDPFIEEIIKRIKPDVIIVDQVLTIPAIFNSGIPWVWSMSMNPLSYDWALDDHRVPPPALGVPTGSGQELWPKYKKELNDSKRELWYPYNEYLISKGCKSLPEFKYLHPSPYLNCYMFPKELDYTDLRQLPKNYYQFDCFKRNDIQKTFEIPEKFRNNKNKLIFLSLGSMGGANVPLMKRLVGILGKSQHKFIISKGPFGDDYELADNMWGQNYLPQIQILPVVDLVITHGGNNTVTETFYHGKLMIVMPLFSDQFDNAQRIEEKGFGIRLNPYECTEQQLLSSIDRLFDDQLMQQRLRTASERIQRENTITKITELIENLIKSENSLF